MDMLKHKFPESVANKMLLFVSSQVADIMKKEIEAVNDEFEDVIGFVIEDDCKIDDSLVFYFSCVQEIKKKEKHMINIAGR